MARPTPLAGDFHINYIAKALSNLPGCRMEINVLELRPAGYAYLLENLKLNGYTPLAHLICLACRRNSPV
jgi:tRNA G37 N-methylase Trm5